ncbi:hypothetical protein FF38_12021 [Lucilia cuprina]|uniref:Uncharacterized protein n=1 Tax=Lucilia cuprina TaxID=7375 RepID=A0A0L0CFJ5_LUCCU|nr:hypothetical protein FF38_12021 [Lucilia cuprina]
MLVMFAVAVDTDEPDDDVESVVFTAADVVDCCDVRHVGAVAVGGGGGGGIFILNILLRVLLRFVLRTLTFIPLQFKRLLSTPPNVSGLKLCWKASKTLPPCPRLLRAIIASIMATKSKIIVICVYFPKDLLFYQISQQFCDFTFFHFIMPGITNHMIPYTYGYGPIRINFNRGVTVYYKLDKIVTSTTTF